jgi:aminopeptidase N
MIETTEPPPGSGIAHALAVARRDSIRDVRYALELSIPAEPDLPVRGRVRIEISLREGSRCPAIDFAPELDAALPRPSIRRLTLDGSETAYEHGNGHILLGSAAIPAGVHVIEIEFESSQKALTRRDDLVYTLFVPAKAHRVFPCFDQPDLKAPLTLTLEIPSEWQAISNAPATDTVTQGVRRRIRFGASEPLPTYLCAFAAGRFEQEQASVDGRSLRLLHHSRNAGLVASNRAEIFRLQAESLRFLEDYTGIGHPFTKIACVLIPDFEFAGMEHPGCIFYRENLLLLDKTADESMRLRRASLIAHETAHLWFGDLVTMRWFGDVWLKEVFASFMADKILERLFPDTDHALDFVLRHYPPAYAIDRTAGTHAIRRSLGNLHDAAELYDALIYHKAPIAMAELEAEIGESAMRAGLRAYLTDFRFANADWPELRSRLEQAAGRELADWSRRWLEAAGKPALGKLGTASRPAEYGSRKLYPDDTDRLLNRLASSDSPLERAAAWLGLYEGMLDGAIVPGRLLTAATRRLETEANELLASRLVEDLTEIVWRFSTPAQRALSADSVEQALRRRLDSSSDAVSRHRWIEALCRLALSPAAATELESIWRGDRAERGIVSEPLAAKLALRLALMKPDEAREIIARQAAATTDPNLRGKLEFVAPALSDRRGERDALFDRLVAGEGRGVWAVAALRLLSHALRADEAQDYLEPGIEHAAALSLHAEIFLPRQWLTALFLGHGTARAAESIRSAVTSGDYAPRFRSLVLETADPVLRAAAIRERSAYP